MNLIVQDFLVRRGLNSVNVRRDSNPLCVQAEPIGTIMHAFFACPTGRMGDEIVKILIEDSGTIVTYEGDIEYMNSFYMNGRFYHAFWARDRPRGHESDGSPMTLPDSRGQDNPQQQVV